MRSCWRRLPSFPKLLGIPGTPSLILDSGNYLRPYSSMARTARAVAVGIPHPVTPRGNRRQPTFFWEDDYQIYLSLMAEWCLRCGVEIWASCLMPNHFYQSIYLLWNNAFLNDLLPLSESTPFLICCGSDQDKLIMKAGPLLTLPSSLLDPNVCQVCHSSIPALVALLVQPSEYRRTHPSGHNLPDIWS